MRIIRREICPHCKYDVAIHMMKRHMVACADRPEEVRAFMYKQAQVKLKADQAKKIRYERLEARRQAQEKLDQLSFDDNKEEDIWVQEQAQKNNVFDTEENLLSSTIAIALKVQKLSEPDKQALLELLG